jgi:hypothetical protein
MSESRSVLWTRLSAVKQFNMSAITFTPEVLKSSAAVIRQAAMKAFVDVCTSVHIRAMIHNDMVGFTNDNHVWHWFEASTENPGTFYMNHSHSMNTGRDKRGYAHRQDVCASLRKRIGEELIQIM